MHPCIFSCSMRALILLFDFIFKEITNVFKKNLNIASQQSCFISGADNYKVILTAHLRSKRLAPPHAAPATLHTRLVTPDFTPAARKTPRARPPRAPRPGARLNYAVGEGREGGRAVSGRATICRPPVPSCIIATEPWPSTAQGDAARLTDLR